MKQINTSDRLKQIMNERNLKQVDILELAKPFCNKYGVSLKKNDLSQYVNGKVEPGQNKLYILGKALNVSEAWLMGYDVPIERVYEQTPSNNDQVNKIFHVLHTLNDDELVELLKFVDYIISKRTSD